VSVSFFTNVIFVVGMGSDGLSVAKIVHLLHSLGKLDSVSYRRVKSTLLS
jgi:D-arabinose 5-phosphate isomerase GutQ